MTGGVKEADRAVANLDCAAHTPLDPDVGRYYAAALREFGNPHAANELGARSAAAVQIAREHVGALVGADPGTVVFTSGATEANNLAIFGGGDRAPRHVVVSAAEHASVLAPIRALQAQGVEVTTVGVDPSGQLRLDELQSAVGPATDLVATMLVNNELGAINDVATVTQLAAHHGARVHCDATQAVGRIDVDVRALGVDTLSLSSHKVHGPAGVGALIVANGATVRPRQMGGGQERGLRSGTVPAALVAAFGEACRIALERRPETESTLRALSQAVRQLLGGHPRCDVVSSRAGDRVGIVSIALKSIAAADVLDWISDTVAGSAGAACHEAGPEPSHVLRAAGFDAEQARRVVRLSVARTTRPWEIRQAAQAWRAALDCLGELGQHQPLSATHL